MPTLGPMAQDPYAIVEILRSIWSDHFMSIQDPQSVPVDFREELYKEGVKYRIGFFKSDGYVEPLPGNQRVIGEAVEMLRAKGHELIPFSLGNIVHETARGIFGTVYADGGARAAEILRDEPLSPLMEPLRAFASMHNWTKDLGRRRTRPHSRTTKQRDGWKGKSRRHAEWAFTNIEMLLTEFGRSSSLRATRRPSIQ
ncbi:hypothetical protein PMAYCL1PPCAC_28077, partial [Pristionchus mayeri]